MTKQVQTGNVMLIWRQVISNGGLSCRQLKIISSAVEQVEDSMM
jgi:hypothetical protein